MPDATRFERCGDHGVRNCLVCHPIAKASLPKSTGEPIIFSAPEIPEFPNDGKPETENVLLPGPVVIATESSPIVSAAVRYTQACKDHAQAQVNVADIKQRLVSAQAYEDSMRQTRIAAQEEMAKLVAEAQ